MRENIPAGIIDNKTNPTKMYKRNPFVLLIEKQAFRLKNNKQPAIETETSNLPF